MNFLKKEQLNVFLIWIAIVPLSFYLTWTYFPSRALDWENIAFLFAILFVTILLPLTIENVSVTLERWIIFTVFLQYGVFAEFIFMQLALVLLILSKKSATPTVQRFFVNSARYAFVSIMSGFVFHGLGGVIGTLAFSEVLLYSALYAVTYTVSNNLGIKAYFHLVKGKPYSLFSKIALWDYMITLVMLPFCITIYFLSSFIGNESMLLVGIPSLLVLLVLKRYTKSNDMNDKLTYASNIGHELADQLHVNTMMQVFIEKLKDVVPYDEAYIIDCEAGDQLIPLMAYEHGEVTPHVKGIVFDSRRRMENGFDNELPKVFHNVKETAALKGIRFIYPIESVMTVPVKRDRKTVGFLLLTSKRRNKFQPIEMKIVDVLASYLAISLEKARYFEQTLENSERCALTKLHNFGYLDKKLDEEIIRYEMSEIPSLTAVILDIDYFKRVNDTYGHASGNTILIELANILKGYTGTDDILARYGGEEFVLLLPGCTKSEASKRAEAIREEVENHSFTIIPDLSEDRTPIEVQITVSVGVANVPKDADSVKALMRNADRALYIGGKQAGRNRVGIYGEEKVISIG